MTAQKPLILGLELVQGNEWIGGTIYVRNLIVCLGSLPPGDRPVVRALGIDAAAPAIRSELEQLAYVEKSPARVEKSLLHRVHRRLDPIGAQPWLRPLDALYPGFQDKIPNVAHIRWIPDLQHVRMPQFFSDEERAARDKSTEAVANSRGVLVLSSEAAQRDFESKYPDATIERRVWRFCTILQDGDLRGPNPLQTYQLPERYLYVPNQFWAHKNHITMFRALSRLKQKGLHIPLVCTGHENDNRNPLHMDGLRRFVSESGLEADIRFLGLVPRADQIQIFRHATAVVQPSLFEGWSTVVEDCKALGRPLFASNIDVHREQLSIEHPLRFTRLFEAENDTELAELIASAWETLLTGPVADDEAAARKFTQRRLTQNAYAFLDIVKEAIKLERASTAAAS